MPAGSSRLWPAWARVSLCLLGILAVVRLPAQSTQSLPVEKEIISSVPVFWGLSSEEKQKFHRVRFEMVVYYYDPFWQLMWGESEGQGSFLPVRGEPLPIKPGQRVRIEGTIQPGRGILRNEVTVTVLQENALPDPIPAKGMITDLNRLNAQWSTVEGVVCLQREVDRTHIEYLVLTDGAMVTVRVLVDETEPVPQLFNTRAKFNGVYIGTTDANQVLQRIDFWVPRRTDISLLGELGEDDRFKLPRTPIDRIERAEENAWIRLVGDVRTFTSGQSLTLFDDSGQLTVTTPQPAALQTGDKVEVVGRVVGAGLSRTLKEPLFRPQPMQTGAASETIAGATPLMNLRVVEQIMELPLGEVARRYQVTLRGVVTWADPRVPFFFLQDASGGICVWREPMSRSPTVVEAVEVRGTTFPGRYAPEIKLQELGPIGTLALPRASTVTLEQAMIGTEEAKLVQIRGYLRQAVEDLIWTRLDLTTASGEFSAFAPADKKYATLSGAIVQVSGVCAATADNQQQLTGVRLWVAGTESVAVEQPPAKDPFSVPRFTITGLKQFSGIGAFSRRALVSGTLISQVPGHYLILQADDSGLMVFVRDSAPLAIGSAVEVTGLPGREGNRVVLREAIARPAQTATSVVPLTVDRFAEPRPELDTRLVRLEAVVNQSVPQNGAFRLTLQAEGTIFDAVMNRQPADWSAPEPGSRLELTGVYLVEYSANRQPRSFGLELRTPADVRILATPAWWTAGRAIAVAAGLAVCTFLGFGWVTILRRRVRKQTEQIRQQMVKEARMQAELERATRLDSLGVLAGGIAHDFNNLLTAIRGNLGLIQLEPAAMEIVGSQVNDAERAAKRATDVTQQLLTFAKGGDPVRSVADLSEVVREAAGFARHGSSVRVVFEPEAGLPHAEIDASQISRVVHNLVLNAVQSLSGGGGVVRLSLTARDVVSGAVPSLPAGRYLELQVTDNGPGIPAERLSRIFDPYFTTKANGSGLGLATCHSIVRKHQGHIEVKSSPTTGTTFTVWLPAADRAPASAKAATVFPFNRKGLRVLFMDDDEVVCNLARTLLVRAGHDGTLVADGAAAVAEYRQAKVAGKAYDLVIVDLTVPGGMGGKDALEELRKIDPAVRVIASSGYSNDPVMAKHRSYGFAAILPKPYDLDAFVRAIERVRAS